MFQVMNHKLLNSKSELKSEVDALGGIDDVNLFFQFYHVCPETIRLKAFFEVDDGYRTAIVPCASLQVDTPAGFGVDEPILQGTIYLRKRKFRRIYNRQEDFPIKSNVEIADGVNILFLSFRRNQLTEAPPSGAMQTMSFLSGDYKAYPSPPAPAGFDI
ncbi:MAG: hypothetical protein MUE58_03625 [Chitinophagaceae bacterium]|jgi:hypothetical protein|nr:hypothetical protein [Chitinophagaceae bacterium]